MKTAIPSESHGSLHDISPFSGIAFESTRERPLNHPHERSMSFIEHAEHVEHDEQDESRFALQRRELWRSSVIDINDSFAKPNRRSSGASNPGAVGDGSPRRRDRQSRPESLGSVNSLQRGLYPTPSTSNTTVTTATPTTAPCSTESDPFVVSGPHLDDYGASNDAPAKLQLDELATGIPAFQAPYSLRQTSEAKFRPPAFIPASEKALYDTHAAVGPKPHLPPYALPPRAYTTKDFSSPSTFHPTDQTARSRPDLLGRPSFNGSFNSSPISLSRLDRLAPPPAPPPASVSASVPSYFNYGSGLTGLINSNSHPHHHGQQNPYCRHDYTYNEYVAQGGQHGYPNGSFPAGSSRGVTKPHFSAVPVAATSSHIGGGAGVSFTGGVRSFKAPLLSNRHGYRHVSSDDGDAPGYDPFIYRSPSFAAANRHSLNELPPSYESLRMTIRSLLPTNNAAIADMLRKEKWQDTMVFLQRSHISHLSYLAAEYEQQVQAFFSASTSLAGKQDALVRLHNNNKANLLKPYQYQARSGVRKGQRWVRDPLIPAYTEGYPLYLVSFKNDRVDIFYTLPATRTHMPRLPQLGDAVRVEGDRGDNVGVVIGMHRRMSEAKNAKAELAAKQRHTLMSKFAMRRAGMEGWDIDQQQHQQQNAAGYYATNYNPDHSNDGISNNGNDSPIDGNIEFSRSRDQPWPAFIRDVIPRNTFFYEHLSNKETIEHAAYTIAQKKVLEYEFPMEILNVDIQWDGNKVTCYYYSESYINFQPLVNRLHALFNVRIWMSAINPASMKKKSSDLSLFPAWK